MLAIVGRFALLAWLVVGFGLASEPALSQHVRDASFCVGIDKFECKQPVPHGSQISLSELSSEDGNKALYFWGNLRNPSQRAIGIYFAREGSCYKEQLIIPKERTLREVGFFENAFSFVDSLTFGELWNSIGFEEIDFGVKDARINIVFIPNANQYRVFSYRYALCPGRFVARLIDSWGEPIPGNNHPREIEVFITE